MKIGLFGGSFDPIHNGHIALAKKAIETLSLDSFWFIPAKNNPWKENKIANDEDRIKMIEIAIKNLNKVKVSRIELDTIDTIKKLLILYPDNEYFYLIGMDQVCAFNYWKSAEQFPSLVQLVAFNRGGYPKKHPNLDKYHFIKIENILILASYRPLHRRRRPLLDADRAGLHPDRRLPVAGRERRHPPGRLELPRPARRMASRARRQVRELGAADHPRFRAHRCGQGQGGGALRRRSSASHPRPTEPERNHPVMQHSRP